MIDPIPPQDATGIYRQQISQAAQAAQAAQATEGPRGAGRGTAARRVDEVSVSERARELQRALQAADQQTDVRPDVVAQLQEAIESGTYQVDAAAIARHIAAGLRSAAPPAAGE